MSIIQCSTAIQKLISGAESTSETALLQLYASCLTLFNEATKPENFNSKEMNLSDYRHQSRNLHSALEHLRLAVFTQENKHQHLQSAIVHASMPV